MVTRKLRVATASSVAGTTFPGKAVARASRPGAGTTRVAATAAGPATTVVWTVHHTCSRRVTSGLASRRRVGAGAGGDAAAARGKPRLDVARTVSRAHDSRFLRASAVLALLGCLLAAATPLVAGASRAFAGSIATTGVLGAVFAARNLQLYRRRGTPAVPPSVLTTAFGVWFTAAPLLYDVGFLATAGTQSAGLLVAAFGGYTLVAALTGDG